MKLELLDVEKLIEVNKAHKTIVQVTSPRLFSNKMVYDPQGILSTDLFGVSKGDRKGIFGYIDLGRPFLHPHIYGNVLKRMFRNIIHIVSGQRKYSVINGKLEQNDAGWTGIQSLYDHWNEIDWNKSNSSNERNLTLLKGISRDQVFMKKMIICPPAYRDVVLAGTVDSSDHVNELNDMYVKLIRAISGLNEGGMFARTQYATQYKIQETLLEISDYFKGQVSKKTGLIRRYLIGKSVEYGTRAVISAPTYNNETINDNMVDLEHTALPIAQVCSTFYPFIESWLKNFFTREIIQNPNLISYYDVEAGKEITATLNEPEVQFSDKNIKRMINDYVFNPDNRFKIIPVEALVPDLRNKKGGRPIKAYMILKGKKMLSNEMPLARPMTVTDLLYLACHDVVEEKRHVMVTRYPVGTDKGLFINNIRVASTRTHQKIIFNNKEYPFYPDIDFSIPQRQVGVQFIDTAVFSNSLLDGMGGDYDGDQVSIKGIWTDEANMEADEIMGRKMTALNITGTNSRVVAKEVFNSFYALTKEGPNPKKLDPKDVETYLAMSPDGFTRGLLVKMLADTTSMVNGRSTQRRKARHQTWDRMTIPADYFYPGQKEIETTIGRFLVNKYVLEGSGIVSATKIVTGILNKGGLGDLDNLIGELLMEDVIDRKAFNAYVNRRDNLGYWVNGMLAHTISLQMAKPLAAVEKKKRELYKKYEKEILDNNITVMNQIEKELVEFAYNLLKDDPGMDLYLSGDLDFGNNYKNNSILKGPVKNKITNEFDFIGNSFMDGIEIKDVPAHANSILTAQFPASIATKESGYMGKKLLALLQMTEVDAPGTDCGTKATIPITVTNGNKNDLKYSYHLVGGQLQLLTKENINSFVGKTIMVRSPMGCTTQKICNMCAGELFYKLGVEQAGLFATQLSHSALNLALKSKHVQTINLYEINPDTIIEDI